MPPTLFEKEARQLRPLRPRQATAIRDVREAIREGHRRIILQAPTGFGKTLVAAHIITSGLRKGSRPLFTCPAITLVDQTLKAFEAEGIYDVGVMQAHHERTNPAASLQIACVPTLVRRQEPEVDFALIDEVHEEFEALYKMINQDSWKGRVVIGLSATPWKKGMGLRWEKLVVAATINDLIADGHATPATVYAPARDVDRGAIRVVRGEFDEEQSASVMSHATIVGDVIEEWKKRGLGGKTFAFCHNRAHAQAQMFAFQDNGIPFGYIDCFTGREERTLLFKKMGYGEIAGIASVGCLIRGVDEDVRCILDLQLTRSEIRHVQKWGRGVRCADGKECLIGLDHAGNNISLGLFTDIFHDHLDTTEPSQRAEPYWDDNKPVKPKKCPKCGTVIPPTNRLCPSCGERIERQVGVKVIDGRLVEVGAAYKADAKMRQAWYSGLLWIAHKRNLKPGWVAYSYQDKFGVWPKDLKTVKRKPKDEITEWVDGRYKNWRATETAHVTPPADPPNKMQLELCRRIGYEVPAGATRSQLTAVLDAQLSTRRS